MIANGFAAALSGLMAGMCAYNEVSGDNIIESVVFDGMEGGCDRDSGAIYTAACRAGIFITE